MDAAITDRLHPAGGGVRWADTLKRVRETVRSFWGFESLRPLQADAIRAALSGRDSVVVLPTGGGKSLCYQVPPVVAGRTDVVVSPLISLMNDQLDGLRQCGYPAAVVHSGVPQAERDRTLRDIRDGRFRLIFVSPERLLTPWFLDLIEHLGVRAFAIDEAHCISQWGHDFRTEYRKLAVLKQRFPSASVHAYTATATRPVREDIAAQLGLADPAMLVGTFDRPNLTYRVVPRLDLYDQVIEAVRRHAGEGVIVYCLSRKDTDEMASMLKAAGIDARAYHAGLDADQRRRTQEAFATESLNVVAATVAFGMGIDRSNVRCVIHATMPKSIEHYQQETGRAGRDGLEAECVLFYSMADVMRWESLIRRSAEGAADPQPVIDAGRALLESMRRFCCDPQCRHRALSEYFGQSYTQKNCEACDVCLDEADGFEEATVVAQKILSCVARIEKCSRTTFGVAHTVDVLLGANTEMIRRCRHDQLSTYGILKGTPKKTASNWVYRLLDQGLLSRTSGERPVLELNEASWDVMRGGRTVRFVSAPAARVTDTPQRGHSWEGVDRGLFEHLRNVRRRLAEADGVPAFVIFSDNTLRDLARRRPTSADTLRGVFGIGEAKRARFGDLFLSEIAAYCQENGVSTDAAPAGSGLGPADYGSVRAASRRHGRTARPSPAKRRAFDLFAGGRSVESVAAELERSPKTVAGYLCEFVAAQKPASVQQWVDAETYRAVAESARVVGTRRLKPIFEKLGGRVPYEEIRLVVAHLESQ